VWRRWAWSNGRQVEHLGLEAAPLGPAQVHPHQHLGPVLGVHTPRARAEAHDHVVVVVGAGEHQPHLQRADPRGQRLHFPPDLSDDPFVIFLDRQRQQLLGVVEPLVEGLPLADLIAQPGEAAHRGLRGALVVPEIRVRAQLLEFGDLRLFAG
jgi:hypothetical protein